MQGRIDHVPYDVLQLTEAKQRLAHVQIRLEQHPEAWATLMEALELLQTPTLDPSFDSITNWTSDHVTS